MSGHSKWSTIKRQKGAADQRRGQQFTKLSNAITIAVREGGGETRPENNFKLRLAVDRARSFNMPKENIERAINRGRADESTKVEELLYEGFAPGGIALIIEAITDNKQRTTSEVKNVLEKNGGALVSPGSVSYLFKRKGEIVAKKNDLSSDELLNKGIESGAEDMEEEGDRVFFYMDRENIQEAKKNLEENGLTLETYGLVFTPESYITVEDNLKQQVINLVEKLNDLDDVQEVYTNLAT